MTHDPIDASVLADRLIVLEHGRVVQQGTPLQVARRPRTDYVARLVGLNLLAGSGAATGYCCRAGERWSWRNQSREMSILRSGQQLCRCSCIVLTDRRETVGRPHCHA